VNDQKEGTIGEETAVPKETLGRMLENLWLKVVISDHHVCACWKLPEVVAGRVSESIGGA